MGLHQGFEYWDERQSVPLMRHVAPFYLRESLARWLEPKLPPRIFEYPYRDAESINRAVFPLLDELAAGDRPFFLFVNYMDAHWPYRPPDAVPGSESAQVPLLRTKGYEELIREVSTLEREIEPSERAHLIARYDASISFLDARVGRLLDRLDELGLAQNSLVIVTSDHGETFGERHWVGHQSATYQDEIHVPLIVRFPGEARGRVDDRPTSSVDLAPTVLDVLGLTVPETMQGRSLRATGAERAILSEHYPMGVRSRWHPRHDRTERALVRSGYKFIRSSRGKRELYDLATDPDEQRDLAALEPEIAEALEFELDGWLSAVSEPDTADEPEAIGPETEQRLRALGYIE